MTEVEQQFLKILKALVKGEQMSLPKDANLNGLLQLSKIHSLTAAVAFTLNQQLQLKTFNDMESARELQHALFETVVIQTQRLEFLDQLLNQFKKNKITAILLKGCVVNKYYSEPAIRTFGDIDLLIHLEDRQRVDSLMQTLGYEKHVAEDTVWRYIKGNEKYELHISLLPDTDILPIETQEFLNSAWENVLPTKQAGIYKLDPNYHFVFLLLHLAKHMQYYGAGVRMYLDLALMLKNEPDLDFEKIYSYSNKIGQTEFLNTVLYLCERWFEFQGPNFVNAISSDVFKELEEYIISAGLFGFHNRNLAIMRLRNTKKYCNRCWALIRYIFPPYRDIKNVYPKMGKYPLLLPLLWVARWFDGIFLRRKKASKIFCGILTETDAARKSKDLLQSIGLKGKIK